MSLLGILGLGKVEIVNDIQIQAAQLERWCAAYFS